MTIHLTRHQWHNLFSSYRWQRRMSGQVAAIAWIASFNPADAELLRFLGV